MKSKIVELVRLSNSVNQMVQRGRMGRKLQAPRISGVKLAAIGKASSRHP